MHRFLYLAQPRAGLTPAEFRQCWRDHSRLAATCPEVLEEVRGYRQWQVVEPGDDGVVGVAETRCADAAAVYRMLECTGTREILQPDELRFLALPCRATGLVADETMLSSCATADAAMDHACFWLAPRRLAPSAPHELTKHRVAMLYTAFTTVVASMNSLQENSTAPDVAHELSSGHRDAADEASPFAVLLLARFASAVTAAAVAAAWREALLPGENVWLLQRAARHPVSTESVP